MIKIKEWVIPYIFNITLFGVPTYLAISIVFWDILWITGDTFGVWAGRLALGLLVLIVFGCALSVWRDNEREKEG